MPEEKLCLFVKLKRMNYRIINIISQLSRLKCNAQAKLNLQLYCEAA